MEPHFRHTTVASQVEMSKFNLFRSVIIVANLVLVLTDGLGWGHVCLEYICMPPSILMILCSYILGGSYQVFKVLVTLVRGGLFSIFVYSVCRGLDWISGQQNRVSKHILLRLSILDNFLANSILDLIIFIYHFLWNSYLAAGLKE